ncbi:hypothetical protein AVEN_134356-1 [Araneus ventricosus]|uniref:Uncharacterized protein n=1 Tax=Araneus ventricosus TaxID=182803 RepID=A0A4Y2RFL9_ARAVE|nr:hypothetical protein AVEN_134356-1 [Araneus ventricosus]
MINQSGKASDFVNDIQNYSKLSILGPIDVSQDTISSKSCFQTEPKKVRADTLCGNTYSCNPKLSVLSPVAVSTDRRSIKSNYSRLTDDTSKRVKVSILDNGIQNDPKSAILNSGFSQTGGKKLESVGKKPPNNKRKAHLDFHNDMPRKKHLVINKAHGNQSGRFTSFPKENQSPDTAPSDLSDISSYLINIVEQRPKKLSS